LSRTVSTFSRVDASTHDEIASLPDAEAVLTAGTGGGGSYDNKSAEI
jgi:hypothetical protein